jgi:hypothetical protein
MISEDQYAQWAAAWKEEHPNKVPPSYKQTIAVQDMLNLPDSTFQTGVEIDVL